MYVCPTVHIVAVIIAVAVLNATCCGLRVIVARENVKIRKGHWWGCLQPSSCCKVGSTYRALHRPQSCCLGRLFVVPGSLLVSYDAFCNVQSALIFCVCVYILCGLFHQITELLTPLNRLLPEKLTCSQLVIKFPAFTSARMFLSWTRRIYSMPPHPTSWRSILILFSHLRLGLLRGLFPSSLPTKTLYAPFLSPILATFPPHLITLDLIERIFGEVYRASSSLLRSLLHPPNTLSLLCPNILLSTLFSNALTLRYSLTVTDQVSHP